jgi:hypothetical protein
MKLEVNENSVFDTKISIDDKIFWKEDFTGSEAKGGFFIRAVELKKFLKMVEAADHGGEVVGLRFSDNNLEVIVQPKK